jgi:preprotein translocase subunit SecE
MATKKDSKPIKKGKPAEMPAEPGSKFQISRISEFSQEVKNEFNKIAWPDKKHTMATTGVVVVLVFLVSFYLGTVDLLLGKLIGLVIK